MKKCYQCEITKEITDFVISNGYYRNICKRCQADNNYFKVHGHLNRTKRQYEAQVSTKKNIEEETKNEILRILGYDLNGELSVHEQFLQKHNLVNTR